MKREIDFYVPELTLEIKRRKRKTWFYSVPQEGREQWPRSDEGFSNLECMSINSARNAAHGIL